MSADMSFFHLIAGASFVVQLVMLLLLTVSVVSWTMIFRRHAALRDAREAADEFEDRFWSGGDLSSLFREVSAREPRAVVEGAQRVMRVVLSREMDSLETHLSFLATVGSTSPYVGLFGTVWGIMNAFRGLGNAQQATLAMVAPGIAEALIATAMGLFAAIPAVIAYNRYSNDVERLINRYDNFLEEFSTILQRQSHV